ncbi:MAG: tripartite tricarboxylate transporter substrate binding protein [Betaproteobacteria bacterium]|nr:tripartite tricarboxylate transporter substrate binding protein [Betaproteobacteria bacterium]
MKSLVTLGRTALTIGVAICCAGAFAQAPAPAAASNYPAKPVRFIVPFPPGASSDVVGRLIAHKLGEYLGQQVIVDNRPGVGGNLGIGQVAKSAPDGYTMVVATASIAVSVSLYANPGYDAVKDLAPVARLASIPNVLLVHPSVPAKTLKQFVDLARAYPGKLNFGSGGTGTTNHLANELLKHLEKINIVHVPYKGVTQAMIAMSSGEVDEVVMPVTTATPQIKAGKVRPLAVLTEKRIPTVPDVPTAIEAGVKDFTMPLWYGMFVPVATPRAIVERLSKELIRTLQASDVTQKLTALGVTPWPGTSQQLADLLKSDIQRYGMIVKSAGLPKQ